MFDDEGKLRSDDAGVDAGTSLLKVGIGGSLLALVAGALRNPNGL